MRRPLILLLALALGAASAVLVACGSSNPHLLSAGRASRLQSELDAIANAVDSHQCVQAIARAQRLSDEVNSLPRDTDPQLRTRLQDGATNLAQRAKDECQKTTPTVTTTTPTETVPTATTTTPTTTTPTTTTTTPTTTTTTPTTTTTTPTTTTPDSGGSTAPPGG